MGSWLKTGVVLLVLSMPIVFGVVMDAEPEYRFSVGDRVAVGGPQTIATVLRLGRYPKDGALRYEVHYNKLGDYVAWVPASEVTAAPTSEGRPGTSTQPCSMHSACRQTGSGSRAARDKRRTGA